MHNSKGYLLGRLLARLEYAGATRFDQYGVASVTPTPVIVPAFTRLAQMGKSDAISDIMSELPGTVFEQVPMSADDQATFPLGYWQEKARLGGLLDKTEEPLSSTFLIRMEPSLKAWTIENGGSDLIRNLLRREKRLQDATTEE